MAHVWVILNMFPGFLTSLAQASNAAMGRRRIKMQELSYPGSLFEKKECTEFIRPKGVCIAELKTQLIQLIFIYIS